MKRHLVDAREMEHPEPLRISIECLKEMNAKDYFYMLNKKNPIPLLEMANEKGFLHLSHQDEQGIWHILITKNPTLSLKELLDV